MGDVSQDDLAEAGMEVADIVAHADRLKEAIRLKRGGLQ